MTFVPHEHIRGTQINVIRQRGTIHRLPIQGQPFIMFHQAEFFMEQNFHQTSKLFIFSPTCFWEDSVSGHLSISYVDFINGYPQNILY